MAKAIQIKPEEAFVRGYADRLILEKLTEINSAVKLSELADRLQDNGIGLAAIRSLLASNPEKFAYAERRWIPAARLESTDLPLNEAFKIVVDRFGGPMPLSLVITEISHSRGLEPEYVEDTARRIFATDPRMFITNKDLVGLRDWVFSASDEGEERAFAINGIDAESVDAAQKKLKDIDWRSEDAVTKALGTLAPISAKILGAVAWRALNPSDLRAVLLFDWRAFASTLLSVPGYTFASDGVIYPESESKKWISAAIKLAERIAPSVEIEDAAPIDIKQDDTERMIAKIAQDDESVTATRLLEDFYEITPSVKTFPDDIQNVMNALKADSRVWWVGGDRFRKPNTAPDFVYSVPDLFKYEKTTNVDEEGELVDVELTDDGLSSTLRKLLTHPLATDVLDEEIMPAPKQTAEQLRLVLKPIHRELGTFPLCQFPTGWLDSAPTIQELIFRDEQGRELSVWMNTEARLMFGLIDWFYEQPVESGAVFSLTRTGKPNVFDFAWLDQTDPVVFITSQRMEELREIQSRSDGMSTLQLLKEVMTHWPKGADFLTILWELNVVRRTPRRLVASLLSSYLCFYQRSGSPVWHFDAKKVELGFDKTKRKFIRK